jgi:hypothetical protein
MTTLTTLTFFGSHFSYHPTRIITTVDSSKTVKYHGVEYQSRQPIATPTGTKELKFRNVLS